ncbi:MAG: bifunctional hydroxymethylpyrimidine kinase/phosphomethylpyrimidine kinase [Alphaproteobacteria bacterium]|jgi:hydroxymethylpyrimidine/phosphomethylpyrimidine kinase|nr:bifunctional hydroxymethylpyrimidine kinase/phosphomethylpyrimidine kinase [Alphaproteobacteria bacterium]
MADNSYIPPKVLSIAGFDGSCGAGLQADLKVISSLKCYGLNILTSLPIQNTMGVQDIFEIPASAVEKQLYCMFEDITPNAIKIGMLFNSEIIKVVANFLAKNALGIPIVLDPVMVAKSGDTLLLKEAITTMKKYLIPLVEVITPNLAEASILINKEINTLKDMEESAKEILQLGCKSVLLKGGHLNSNDSNDFYLDNKSNSLWLQAKRIDTNNNHGTGCTLSASIASFIALGKNTLESCKLAKEYTFQALANADKLKMGKGHGSLHHFYDLWN